MRRTFMALSAIAVVAAACKSNKQPPVIAGPTVADSADQTFLKMTSIVTTNGVQRGKVTADTAYVLDDQTRFDLRNSHVDFTTETGAPQGTMDSKRGVYSTRTQILEGWGDVVVKLVDGRSLKSPHVVYNSITHLITSDTSYTITGAQGTQHGIGFTSNQTFTSFKCSRACGGNFDVALPAK
jgi:LPS export ABC transporter protein LptC